MTEIRIYNLLDITLVCSKETYIYITVSDIVCVIYAHYIALKTICIPLVNRLADDLTYVF